MSTAVVELTSALDGVAEMYANRATSATGVVPTIDVSDASPFTADELLRRSQQDSNGTPAPGTATAADAVHEATAILREASLAYRTKALIWADDQDDASVSAAYYQAMSASRAATLQGKSGAYFP